MTDLVERYIHQVGRHLPGADRAEVEAELRSMIADQLEDRFGGAPSQADEATVLAELGDPRKIALSYGSGRSLIGPAFYPMLMTVLRRGWLIVPSIMVFLHVFSALTAPVPPAFADWFGAMLAAVLQATFLFSGMVVLIFALIERALEEMKNRPAFDPLTLPAVDDPAAVNRAEAIFGSVFGALAFLVFLYWQQVGGLTLRFDLGDPGPIIAAPRLWLGILAAIVAATAILELVALRRGRWTPVAWMAETLLEAAGIFGLYFALYRPLFDRLVASNPSLGQTAIIGSAPELLAIFHAVLLLATRGSRLVTLWAAGESAPPHTAQRKA